MEKNIKYFFILLLLFIIFFSITTDLPKRQRWGFFSDSGAYFSIIQSLVYDYDLEWSKDRKDLIRILKRFPAGPMGLFLKRGKDGKLYYAKPFIYPLFAAPFFRLFDVKGLLLFNGLMIFLSILMAYLLLRQYHPEKSSFRFSLIFILATVVPIYIWWIQADLFNFFMMFAGLFFFFYKFKSHRFFYFSSFFFSAAVFSKPSNLIPIGFIYLILLFRKEWKRFIFIFLIFVIFFSGFALFNYLQTGEFNYMGGDRRTYYSKYPFEKPEYTFDSNKHLPKMSSDNFWKRFYISPKMIVLNLFYFLFGRFSGMFIYFFPAFFVLILFFFQKKNTEDWFILLAIVFSIIFFIVVTSDNYLGGGGTVGNRYFLSIFPLFFFLGYKNRVFKFSIIPVIIGLIFLSGVYIDSHYHSTNSRMAGLSFPIKLFPPEKTQYQSLPTNENPRAFGKLMRSGDNKYWIYLLNDNFQEIKSNYFWTDSNKKLELFLAAPNKVKEFEVFLKNIPIKNKIYFQIEHKKRTMILQPNMSCRIRFNKIDGLKIKNKYIYYIKIKSEQSYCPYFENSDNKDKRIFGVKAQIGFTY